MSSHPPSTSFLSRVLLVSLVIALAITAVPVLASISSLVPIAGRWPTADCRPGPTGCTPTDAYGHGAELGWFDPDTATFTFCDWRGTQLHDCVEVLVPDPGFGWEPLVFDHDGDGFSEVAIRNPIDAETRVYRISTTGFNDANAIELWTLEPITTIYVGTSSDQPVTGVWNGETYIGIFKPAGSESKFVLESETDALYIPFPSIHDGARAVVGDWLARGYDQVGQIHPFTDVLHFIDPFDSTSPRFIPGQEETYGIRFVGRLWSHDSLSFYGVFDPNNLTFHLRVLLTADTEPPLPIDINIDPPNLTSPGGYGGDAR
ncbi:MAG: hypothetical protein AAGD38_14875 [Acidobacteriota bacterium]